MIGSVDDSPIVRFVDKILRDCAMRGAKRIRIERHPRMAPTFSKAMENGVETTKVGMRPTGAYVAFSISMEIDEEFVELAMPPVAFWEKFIRRLKVMAQTVDYGPYKSDNGYLVLQTEEKNFVTFFMTTNPNPSSDNVVILEYEGSESY